MYQRILPLAIGLLLWGGVAHALTFSVTKEADTNDGTCDADCSLREAVLAANASPGADDITVPVGTYILDLDPNGTGEDAAATGDLDLIDDVTLSGAGADTTIIDGNGTDRVLDVINAVVEISGVALKNGSLAGGTGGGIGAAGATLTITDCAITGNSTSFLGGGVGASATELEIIGTTISGNSAGLTGGGIYYKGFTRRVVLTSSTVSGNSASSEAGVFIDLECGGCTITNSTIAANSASSGIGGIQCISANPITLTNTIVAGNTGGNCVSTNMATGGHNLDDDGSCPFTGSGDLSNLPAGLEPLQDNGGTTQTHALLGGSPAVDAGDDGACPPLDQRGHVRADGDADSIINCDIGAYERAAVVPIPLWVLVGLLVGLLTIGAQLTLVRESTRA